MSNLDFWNYIKVPISKEQLNIVLIAHVRKPRGQENIKQLQCSETERFSIIEFNEIYQGIVTAGYFVQAVFFNEIDFICDYSKHPENYSNSLIYNLARNGLGDNKKTIIPSFCELMGVRYTTSTSLSCALARNKYYFSSLLNTHNISVPKSWLYIQNGKWINDSPKEGTIVICKPSSESASQGINESKIINYSHNIIDKELCANTIVQEYIEGFECEVPVFKVKDKIIVLPPIGIDLQGKKILDEESSEKDNYGFYLMEKLFSSKVISKIKLSAENAFQILKMDIYGRIDFRVSSNGQVYIFDISTTPYTTKHSSFAYAFEQLGFDYCDIYNAVISAALVRKQS